MRYQMIKNSEIQSGKYTARITNIEIAKSVRFGRYIADVFKPIYAVEDSIVRDNGIFKYKRQEGYLYDAKKNWGYYKFLKSMGINNMQHILDDKIIGKIVALEVYQKNFRNEFDSYVKYPVGRVIKVVNTPF